MRRKRQDFAKRWFTALVVVVLMVAFSFQATLSGEEKDKKHLLKLAPQKKGEYALGEDNTMYLYNGREWEEVEGKRHKFIKAYNGMFHYNGESWAKVQEKVQVNECECVKAENGMWHYNGKDWVKVPDKHCTYALAIYKIEKAKKVKKMFHYNGKYKKWNPVPGKKRKFIKAYNGMFYHNGKEWEPFPPPKGFSIGIGLKGGWSSWSLGDFGLSKEYFENLNSIPGYSASTTDLGGSPFGGFDLIFAYNFPKNHSIGLSAGFQYFPGGTFEQNWTYQDTISTSKLDLSAFVIPVELFYKLPVGKDFFLKLAGGVDFYHATIDYDTSFRMLGEDYFYRGKLKDKKIGSHVSLGVEYSLNKNLALSVNAGYSFAKPNNFTGTLVGRDGAGTEMLLTMARDEFGEMLSIYPTTEPLPPDYRPAEIDLKGLEIAIRITITISWKKIGILIESI